ncbi:hypothetical protein KQX54_014513, partial [Cotesia glomerata]
DGLPLKAPLRRPAERQPLRPPVSASERLRRVQEPGQVTVTEERDHTPSRERERSSQRSATGRSGDKVHETQHKSNSKSANSLCWNCHKKGHPYRHCPAERTIFCQMCGRANETTRTCPHCSEKWRAMGPYRKEYGGNVPRVQLTKAPRRSEGQRSPRDRR